MAKNRRRARKKRAKRNRCQVEQIDVLRLPDDVLLEIFEIYNDCTHPPCSRKIEAWQTLIHVCRRWRSLVLESPCRLNLRLYCTDETPIKDKLDVWPAFPLIVNGIMTSSSGTDNVIAALRQSNRVCQVSLLNLVSWQLEEVLAVMQAPFPELTGLHLSSYDETPRAPVIPGSFLGRSAPRLRYFRLSGIPFRGLPNLLSFTTQLAYLLLVDIPHSGFISPKAMAALLSESSSLKMFRLEFQSPQSRPGLESRSQPPSKRYTLPSLKKFHFKGVTEYLEDLVTFIDAPQLDIFLITFFNQINFDTPGLAEFIDRTPKRSERVAYVQFHDLRASVVLAVPAVPHRTLKVEISCREPDWQLSSIEQICNSFLPSPLSTVQDLYIEPRGSKLVWKTDTIESSLWLQLLRPFTVVKCLYLSKEFAPEIAAALRGLVGANITEVLPVLRNVFVEGIEPSGPLWKNIDQFATARWLSDHPTIAISDWQKPPK